MKEIQGLRLYWDDLHLAKLYIPSAVVHQGQRLRLLLDVQQQHAFMAQVFSAKPKHGSFYLQMPKHCYVPMTKTFHRHVCCLIHAHGLIANLTVRENLLLPFLYHEEQAADGLDERLLEIAALLGFQQLDEQIADQSNFMHALISLGRCFLQQASFILAQDVHIDMSMRQKEQFNALFLQLLQDSDTGLLYLGERREEFGDWGFDDLACLKDDF